MKGLSEIIAEILLVGLGISLISLFYAFYSSSSQTAMTNVENEGAKADCERLSDFMIVNVSENNLTIRNVGGTDINSSHLSGFINNVPIQIEETNQLLKPGDYISFRLGQVPESGSVVKIVGDCGVGDGFYVR